VLELRGKTALVTGASAGIGREIARVLAARGVGVLVLMARRKERLDELAAEIAGSHPAVRVLVRSVDLLDRRAIAGVVDALEREGVGIDVLVNNAGFGVYGRFEKSNWARVEEMLELNVVSTTYLLHRLVPPMIARGHGAVMNVSSTNAMLAQPGLGAYAATKAYLSHLNEAVSAELVGTGVTLTAVCPGPVATEFQAVADLASRPEIPRVFYVSAAEVAEDAVAAMERGQVRVIPGAAMKAAMFSVELLPKAALRPVLRRVGRRLRGRG